MKRFLGVLAAVLLLTGCTESQSVKPAQEGGATRGIDVVRVIVNGSPLTCLVFHEGYAGGLSCDWDRRYA